ncbi:heme ABC transporter permease CcmC [Gammaproteobacteria bacterium AB-CW1]|uniref:Heme exporter protein C n=1 Tax=Natronospira elongata TaxID=3110268 RepID=A0AAP6MJT3_9GAMM|nr:heme ABC transporter permease CcmC [Gammaproteobacteria bacterium AB-CW1]
MGKESWRWFHRFGSPPHVYGLADRMVPWFAILGLACLLTATVWGLAFAPPDYEQGDGFRMIYVHVPAAWLSLFVYVLLALASAIGLIWRMKVAHAVAIAAAPLGAAFTFLSLATGSIWGQPMWGTWWTWDPRLTSQLILLFLYIGFIVLNRAFQDQRSGDRASALLGVVGVVNVPIIHFSVDWWHSLHQPATIAKFGAPSIDTAMLIPLLVMALGYKLFFAWLLLRQLQAELLQRERRAAWTKALVTGPGGTVK